jgi:hypothetical protein
MLKDIAAVVQNIMDEELKGNQHKIDANQNGKIDGEDFKHLRAKKDMKKEEVESVDEVMNIFHRTSSGADMKRYAKDSPAPEAAAHRNATAAAAKGLRASGALKRKSLSYGSTDDIKTPKGGTVMAMKREEVELVDEAFPTVADAHKRMNAGKTSTGSITKTSTGLKHERNYKDEDEDDEKTGKKGKTYGANQKRRTNTKLYKESFMSMLKKLDEQGIRALDEVFAEEVELEVLDVNEINGVQIETIAERTLTEPEMNKREEVVKSMKKGMSGFKQRYGDDAKSVMYATATKIAKKD